MSVSALHRSDAASAGPVPLSGWVPDPTEPAGVTLARLAVVLVAVIGAVRVAHLGEQAAWALLGCVAVLALSACRHAGTALAGAALVWLLGTGFVTHRFGELAFAADDRLHLWLLAAAAGVALMVRAAARHERAHRG